MNARIIASTNLTMSSREISELTGKNHADVMRDIRTMLESLKKDASTFADIYSDSYGRPQPCFYLPKRETLILVSGYDVTMRATIIDRWQELEAKETQTLPEVTDPRTRALIESLVKFDQLEQSQKLLQQQTDNLTRRLDQIETAQTHFTVVGYMSTEGRSSVPIETSALIGRKASKLCMSRDLETGEVPDPRFGKVKTYPKHILDEVVEEMIATA